ncbi:MAG: hypothetical protein AB7I33_03570 [Gemmatimonadales bacterium]
MPHDRKAFRAAVSAVSAVSAVLAVLAVSAVLACNPAPSRSPSEFAALVERLSEPGGYFDTDNLVSNETAYLHVMGDLRRLEVQGGTYIGVGPEQNFSYIAEVEPELAILIDIRRDNMLLHLMFKAMFEEASSRIEYLCLLFGRPVPSDTDVWRHRDLPALLGYVDSAGADPAVHRRQQGAIMGRITKYGIPLNDEDRATIVRFHDQFAAAGLNLTFTSLGRPPRRAYPTVRRLYMETDLEGNRAGYLATERRWQRVRELQRRHRVIPVVGDLAGSRAMPAIAAYLRETNRAVSAFYVSNVEFYLFGAGSFPAFVRNVSALPAAGHAVLIRSWFDYGGFRGGPAPGHFSTQEVQTFQRFLELTAGPVDYWQLVSDSLSGVAN